MKSYVVGGAVRDRLLGLPVSDRDHVVVGSTVDDMIAAGYRPVGKDFPVFLHPTTHEEYALARTERKVAKGYAGFVFHADPTVTLVADLERRDLTINAIAEEASTGTLIDPFDGQRDLATRTLRHVGPAFVEDPVRALRVARFAARFVDFTIAPETEALIRTMTERGEIDALVPERVWQEVARGLMEARPSRMFALLRRTGALERIAPEIDAAFDDDRGLSDTLDRAAGADAPLEVRFGLIACAIRHDAERAIASVCTRLAVPRASREIALLSAAERAPLLIAIDADDAAQLVGAMERCDAFRRGDRFARIREVIAFTVADPAARERFEQELGKAAEAALGVDASAIARSVDYVPERIAAALHAARVAAVVQAFASD